MPRQIDAHQTVPHATPFTREELLLGYWKCAQKNIERFEHKDFIVTTQGKLTFGETRQHANHIFWAIKQLLPPGTGQGIGLLVKNPLKIIPAMLGTAMSGNFFVPLDITFPDSTLSAMMETAGITAILTNSQNSDRAHSFAGSEIPILNLDNIDYTADVPDPELHYAPEDIVQILFTSGSTGQPKGAVEDYRYLTRAVFLHLKDDHIEPEDRQLQLSTFTFSGLHVRMFTALVNGHTLYYYDLKADGLANLPNWMHQNKITAFNATPTVFRNLLSVFGTDEQFPLVTKISMGGEKRLHKDILAVRKHFPSVAKIRLGFASTETQRVSSSIYPITFDFSQENLPSGLPEYDIRVFIWDEDGKPQHQGEEGEIVVYGDSLARGYINNPQLTQERFIPDPQNPGWQYYKTGDLGKILPDGQLVHLGRIDNMVKIKGVRIELDSIENHILSYPGIVQVASRAFDTPRGNKKLASYFVAEQGIQIPVSDLRKYLAERLPRHLLPHYLMPLTELPLTSNGKVARTRLPLPQLVRPALSYAYVAPENELETRLVEIWEEEIGITGIGVTDDFFDVGGDSLIGVLLFARIEEAMGRKLPVSILLTAPTIRKQARLIQSQRGVADFSSIIKVNEGGARTPLFFVPGRGGYPTRILHLAKQIDSQTPIYALQDLATYKNGRRQISIKTIATIHLNAIQEIYPHGPYILVGESMGGKVVYEMAQQLRTLNQPEPILIMLDTYNVEELPLKKKFNLPYYKMLFHKHASILLESNWQGKMEYIRFYQRNFWKKLTHYINRRPGIQKAKTSALPDEVVMLDRANRRANEEYNPQAYPGRVILVKATRGPNAHDPSNGWDRVEIGELVIHPLDCYHGSILFEPAVSKLAKIIQNYIDASISVSKNS